MSDGDDEGGGSGSTRQKSIFGGMGRVRKWSTRPKPLLHSKSFDGIQSDSAASVMARNATLHRMTSAMDMERFRNLSSWLELNGINVPKGRTLGRAQTDVDLFDGVYHSLETLEKAVESELVHLGERQAAPTLLAASDSESSSITSPDKVQTLFDYLVIIAPDLADIAIRNFWNHEKNVFEATVAFAYPPESQFNATSIEHFCFPKGIVSTYEDHESSPSPNSSEANFFVLMLSGGGSQGQDVQYALCMKGSVKIPLMNNGQSTAMRIPICYCIVSQFPFIPFFRVILRRLLDYHSRDLETQEDITSLSSIVSNTHAHVIDEVLRKLKASSIPREGESLAINALPSQVDPLLLCRPRVEDGTNEKTTLLLQWALPQLLLCLSLDKILQVLGILLLEMKVIIVCENLSYLSAAVLGIASLLHPLVWAGPLITVLPPLLHEYMDAPVPLICGVDKVPNSFDLAKGTCIVRLIDNCVELHSDDLAVFDDLKLPESDHLSRELSSLSRHGTLLSHDVDRSVAPFVVDIVIRRIRRHIEQLLRECMKTEVVTNQNAGQSFSDREVGFVRAFVRTQMYQKYRDDQSSGIGATIAHQNHEDISPSVSLQPRPSVPTACSPSLELKWAVHVLFRIALTGINSTGKESSISTQMDRPENGQQLELSHCELRTLNEASEEMTCIDNNEQTPMTAHPTEPTDQWEQEIQELIQAIEMHPNEKAASLSPDSIQWFDDFEVSLRGESMGGFSNQEADSIAPSPSLPSPVGSESSLSLLQQSPKEESHCITDVMGRGCMEIACGPQRADTETTLSFIGTALSEDILERAETDASWYSETTDEDERYDEESVNGSRLSGDNDLKSAISADWVITPSGVTGIDFTAGAHHIHSCMKIQRSWRERMARKEREQCGDDSQTMSSIHRGLDPRSPSLDNVNALSTAIILHKLSKPETWTEGKLFVDTHFTHITWKPALMSTPNQPFYLPIRTITQVALENSTGHSVYGTFDHVVELQTRDSVERFKYSESPAHTSFFQTLHQMVSSNQNATDSVAVLPPLHLTAFGEATNSVETTANKYDINMIPRHAYDIKDLVKFTTKLQRGFIVEKHGRIGKPHPRLLFSDSLCTRLMWTRPHNIRTEDDQQLHGRSKKLRPSNVLFQKNILVSSITEIATGKHTRVFQRSVSKFADDRHCLSIITPTRTLDIVAYSNEDFNTLYHGLSQLVYDTVSKLEHSR